MTFCNDVQSHSRWLSALPTFGVQEATHEQAGAADMASAAVRNEPPPSTVECAVCSRLDARRAEYAAPGPGHNPSGMGDMRVMRKRHADSGTCPLAGASDAA